MKILFLARHFTYYRNFDAVLRELAARGHSLHLAVEQVDALGGTTLVESLAAEFPNVTYGTAPSRQDDDWAWAADRLRLGLDYLRYQHPLFDTGYKLRARARERTPGAFVRLGDFVHAAGGWSRRAATALVHRVERAVPEEPAIRRFIEHHNPDVVLITPLIDLGSSQIEYLRAARALRIPTALCVWSWDHLSSKALIRDWPDRVFVWNPTQKREAMQLHGVPANRIVVTGAQCFDQWFDRRPSRDRAAFCREVGLPPDRPYLLWVCSALFQGSPVEAEFVVEWIRQVRASSSPALREAGILVRPHPSRLAEWAAIDVRALGAVVWGSNPIDARSRADYFDSLYYSGAVVGLNTSAFIEAGIVGRAVHTMLVPAFAENQTATVHFDYLLKAGGGLLTVARDFGEHLRLLEASLVSPQTELKPFVREFVRPLGLDRPATPVFVAAVEDMAGMRVEGTRRTALAPLWRRLATHVVSLRHHERFERLTLSVREYASAERLRELRRQKAIRRAAQRAATEPERQQRLAARAAKLDALQKKREARLAEKIQKRREQDAARAGKAGTARRA